MFKKYQTIRDFDNYLLNRQTFPSLSPLLNTKQNLLMETQDNCPETDKPLLKTRSLKLRTLSIQTSFRNKFLQKHVQSFKKHFVLYLEKSYPELKNCTLRHQINQIFGNDQESYEQNEKLKELFKKDKKYFQLKEKLLFQVDLFYEESFYEFLSSICVFVPSQVGLQLFYVANFFWRMYVQNQRAQLTEQEIKVLVQNLMESEELQNFIGSALFLNFRNANRPPVLNEANIVAYLKSFLKVYGFTILMVIQQYFSNPFYKGQESRQKIGNVFQFRDISNDEFSDGEEQIGFHVCNKKRKF